MAKDIDFTFQLILVVALGALFGYLYTNRDIEFYSNSGELVTEEFVCPSPFKCTPQNNKVYHPIIGRLPAEESDIWSQANPNGRGALDKKNFLDSSYMASQIETIGQTKSTMNTGLRSQPVVPQFGRSVWRPDLFKPTDIEQRILNDTSTC